MNKKIISIENLKFNIDTIKKMTTNKLCIMVKNNAYGHGIENIVPPLDGEVEYFGVHSLDEALKIKPFVSKSKILIVGQTSFFKQAYDNNFEVTIFSFEELKRMILELKGLKIHAHIKINTGMNRLGISSIYEFKQILRNRHKFILEGISTHFSNISNTFYTNLQVDKFKEYIRFIPKLLRPLLHAGGSGMLCTSSCFDMIRVGIYAYGYGLKELKPVMKITTTIMQVREIKAGESVGYDNLFTAQTKMKIGVLGLGYGDGFYREYNNAIIFINNQPHKILGKICMDSFMVELFAEDHLGDTAVVMSNASQLSSLTEYEVLSGFNQLRE
ncbi:MAG: alanine racemase [Clostridia bacterium]